MVRGKSLSRGFAHQRRRCIAFSLPQAVQFRPFGGNRCTGAGCVDNVAGRNDFPGFQHDTVHVLPGPTNADHFVGDIFHAILPGLSFPPFKHGVAVKITLVVGVVAAEHDIVQIIKGIGLGNLFRCHDAGVLHRRPVAERLVFLQHLRKNAYCPPGNMYP